MAEEAAPAVPEQHVNPPNPPLRVFFFPFFATGHILPMVDLARQLSACSVDCTLVLTPANAALVRRAVDRVARAGHPIRLLTFPFPAAEAGLPEGVENLVTDQPSEVGKIYRAVALLEPARRRIFLEHRPDAFVADWWTTGLDRRLGIPWVTFRCLGAFPVCVLEALNQRRPQDGPAEGDDLPFVVPGLPDPVEMVRSELPEFLQLPHDPFNDSLDRLNQAARDGWGCVSNTFYELEPAYADLCRRANPDKDWLFVGPLALYCDESKLEDEVEAAAKDRGVLDDESSPDKTNAELCVAWLGTQPPASVLFVCFGSWCNVTGEQLQEITAGLEASGCAFLWVVREREEGLNRWLPEGFEARVAGRGLVVRGWAPQVALLGHPAVGGFVTHCGWNSVLVLDLGKSKLEALSAGVPMVTWPLSFEQFINERLVVNLLRVGMKMHGGFRSSLPEAAARAVVKSGVIAKVAGRFAAGGGDGQVEEMRRRAKEYARTARAAVGEGGSARRDMDRLVEQLHSYRRLPAE